MAAGKMTRYPRKKKANKPHIVNRASPGKSIGFPKSNIVQLNYVTNVVLNDSIGGLMQKHFFRANGLNDPDQSGTGHQPLGFDQLKVYYNHYRVITSRCRVKATRFFQVANQVPSVLGLYLSDDTTIPPRWTDLAESGRGSHRVVSCLNTETYQYQATYTQKSFFKGQGINQSALGALVVADPAEEAYFCIYQQSADLSGVSASTSYAVEISYLVEFSEPKDLDQS